VAEVRITPLGFAYVRFFIRHSNSPLMTDLPYKVDSGANGTTINTETLRKLGYDENWVKACRLLTGNERPTVATGEPIDNCYVIALPEIHLGGYVGYNWPFLVSLNDKIQFKLLLGTDTMQFFNWNFDYENGVCKFELIPGKRKLLFNQKEQSIHAIDEVEGISLYGISQNPEERARFRSRRIWLQDREHEQAVARKEGREEARTEYEPLLASKDAEIEELRARLRAVGQ